MIRAAAAGLALLALAACGTDAARTEPPNVPTSGDPPAAPPPVETTVPRSASSSSAQPERPPERATIELGPWQGELLPLLEQHVARAKAQNLTAYVEFTASWCPPCKALKRYWNEPRMEAAFKGTYIVVLDVDDWQDKLKGTGFVPKTVPVFYAIDDKGKPTGRKITGDDWAKKEGDPPPPKPEPGKPRILPNHDTPDRMAPALQAFFATR